MCKASSQGQGQRASLARLLRAVLMCKALCSRVCSRNPLSTPGSRHAASQGRMPGLPKPHGLGGDEARVQPREWCLQNARGSAHSRAEQHLIVVSTRGWAAAETPLQASREIQPERLETSILPVCTGPATYTDQLPHDSDDRGLGITYLSTHRWRQRRTWPLMFVLEVYVHACGLSVCMWCVCAHGVSVCMGMCAHVCT